MRTLLQRFFSGRWTRPRIVVAAVMVLALAAVALVPRFVHPSLAAPAVQITDPVNDASDGLQTGVSTRTIYQTKISNFNYSGGYVLLANCDSGTTMVADDALRLTVTAPGGSPKQVEFDYYTHTFPAGDVTALFGVGNNSVKAELIDLMGPQYGSKPFCLVPSATRPSIPTLRVEPPPPGTQFNYPWRFSYVSRDPVNTYTGSYAYSYADINIAGRGPSPQLIRAYNGNDTRVSPLGPGWTFNYASHLAAPAPDSPDIVFVGPQGRSDLYKANGDGTYSPPQGVYTTLVKNGDGTYTATFQDQTTWTFDGYGKLIRIQDRYGNTSLLDYDSSNRVVSVSDPAGRGSLSFGYNAAGLLETVSDWSTPARVVRYGYDSSGRLQTVTDRELKPTTFTYDGASSRLASIIDANGHIAVSNTYDSQGRVHTQKDAQGINTSQQTVLDYVENGDGTKTTTVTYPATSYEPTWKHQEIDTYDGLGRLTRHVAKPTSNGAEWVTNDYTWDAQSNRDSAKDGRGNVSLFCYDTDYAGATVPGSHGNLTRMIEPPAEAGAKRAVTLFKYDSKNNLVQTVSPDGVNSTPNTNCSSDLSGIDVRYATDQQYDPQTQTKLVQTTQRYTDPDSGLRTAISRYEYGDSNNMGRITRIITPRGNAGSTPDYSYATTLEYYSSGSQAGMLKRETDPNGSTVTHNYDAVGRETSWVDPNGNVAGGIAADHTWQQTYDKEDRVRFVVAPAPKPGTSPLAVEMRYDPVGNAVVQVDQNKQITKLLYDERDALQEVQQSSVPWTDPNTVPADLIRTQYAYDNLGSMTRALRAGGDAQNEEVTDYLYDGLNRERKETEYPSWPSTSGALTTERTYDLSGNQQTLKDALGRTTTYGHDARNLLRTITYSDGVTPNVAYTYDLNASRLTMQDGTGLTSYKLDELNRMVSVTSPSESGPQAVGYRYDLDGNRVKLLYPDGTAVTYGFDKGDRMESLTDWATRSVRYGYFADNNLHTVQNPNGTSAEYSYDNAQRLTDLWNREGAFTISRHTYSLDSASNSTRLDEVLPENGVPRADDDKRRLSTTYGYDSLYRLTSESSADVNASYLYFPTGNRKLMTTGAKKDNAVSFSYDRADRLTQMGGVSVTVDANGNMVARGKETYTYDQANRLVFSRMPQPTQYFYNGDGLRVKTDAGQGPLVTHVYDVNRPNAALLYDGRRKYVYGLDLAYAVDGNGTMEVYHKDGLGSVRAVTFPNGNVTENYQTDAFGVQVQRQGTSNQRFQFTGEQRDKETGFYYLRSRYYDPSMGRFVERDPTSGNPERPLTLNNYSYVENNPASRVDPSGLSSSLVLNGDQTQWFYTTFIMTSSTPNGWSKLWNSRQGGPWDFKKELKDYKGTGVQVCGKIIEYQSPGNFVLGCSAAQNHISERKALAAGSQDEIWKRVFSLDVPGVIQSIGWKITTGSFDNPVDQKKISEGYQFCSTLNACVTQERFCGSFSADRPSTPGMCTK